MYINCLLHGLDPIGTARCHCTGSRAVFLVLADSSMHINTQCNICRRVRTW